MCMATCFSLKPVEGMGGPPMPLSLYLRSLLPQFIAAWKPLAEWVKANEAGTLGYEAMIADTDPLKVMVFER